MASVEERLVDLELRFLAVQDELEKLSSVVYEQQLELNRNATEIRRLRETLALYDAALKSPAVIQVGHQHRQTEAFFAARAGHAATTMWWRVPTWMR